jgi:hypothetical protein
VNAVDLGDALAGTGYPVTYREWKPGQVPSLPYVVYLFVSSADVMADNENFQGVGDYHVELYSANKDPTAEAAVEAQLRALGLAWSKLETYIDTEAMYQILYTVRIVESQESVS